MMAAEHRQQRRGGLRYDEPMAEHTSWRTGGRARCFYQPPGIDELCLFLQDLDKDEPLLWLGLGSNLLIRDGGFPGTVIHTFGALSAVEWLDDSTLNAASGVTCSKLARMSARAGRVGIEFLAGIPGTLGGALAMNAGAFDGEIWPHVQAVETVDRNGQRQTRLPSEYRIGYRTLEGPANEWFVAARLRLEAGDAQAAQDHIKALLARRSETQPVQQYSCGSVFRNPPGDHAARLIEAAGLKGLSVGGACVSEQHANFIINTGTATAADIEMLINQVQGKVEQRYDIRLETEVRITGEKPAS